MRTLKLLAAACLLWACYSGCSSSNDGADAGLPDAGSPDASDVVLSACVDQPTTLAMPPKDTLPCELIPPGVMLTIKR